jgi:hypothetical protein
MRVPLHPQQFETFSSLSILSIRSIKWFFSYCWSNPLPNLLLILLYSGPLFWLASRPSLGESTFDIWCAVSLTSCYEAESFLLHHQSFPNIPNKSSRSILPAFHDKCSLHCFPYSGIPVLPTSNLANLRSIWADVTSDLLGGVWYKVWLWGGPNKGSLITYSTWGKPCKGQPKKVRVQMCRGKQGYVPCSSLCHV